MSPQVFVQTLGQNLAVCIASATARIRGTAGSGKISRRRAGSKESSQCTTIQSMRAQYFATCSSLIKPGENSKSSDFLTGITAVVCQYWLLRLPSPLSYRRKTTSSSKSARCFASTVFKKSALQTSRSPLKGSPSCIRVRPHASEIAATLPSESIHLRLKGSVVFNIPTAFTVFAK